MAAILIDLQPEKGDDPKQEIMSLLNSNYDIKYYVYIIHATDNITNLRLADDHRNVVDVTVLENTDNIAGFYQMKMSMDQKDLVCLNIICHPSSAQFWHDLCNILLTPQYTWTISRGVSKEDIKSNKKLVARVKKYLSMLPACGDVEIMCSSLIPPQMFHHGYHTRNGGISQIPGMKSMNIVHTKKKKVPTVVVEENRRRLGLAAGYDPTHFHIGRAVHGKTVWVLGTPKPLDGCDAVVTNKPGEVIAAPGADCIVMVFADPQNQCCGVCHASWIGTLKDVAMETVRAMNREFASQPKDILVVMGPSINSCCFHLTDEEASQVSAREPSCVIHRPNDSRNYIDLQKLNRILLEKGGILSEHIDDESLTICTSCNGSKFFSFNRDDIPFGNQVGFISIKNNSNGFSTESLDE